MLMLLEDLMPGDIIKPTKEYKEFCEKYNHMSSFRCWFGSNDEKLIIVKLEKRPILWDEIIDIYYYLGENKLLCVVSTKNNNQSIHGSVQVFEIVSLIDD